MHVYKYMIENGLRCIPSDKAIHHIDGDKLNNDIDNLLMMDGGDHQAYHTNKRLSVPGEMKKQMGYMSLAQEAAKEWHGSEDGNKWHKEHYDKMKDKMNVEKEFICVYCGQKYTAIDKGHNMFCSNSCSQKHTSSLDRLKEDRECMVCGELFRTSKYRKTKTCSRRCATILSHRTRKEKNI